MSNFKKQGSQLKTIVLFLVGLALLLLAVLVIGQAIRSRTNITPRAALPRPTRSYDFPLTPTPKPTSEFFYITPTKPPTPTPKPAPSIAVYPTEVKGGGIFRIEGINLGTGPGIICFKVGTQSNCSIVLFTVLSWTETKIEVRVANNPPLTGTGLLNIKRRDGVSSNKVEFRIR